MHSLHERSPFSMIYSNRCLATTSNLKLL